MRHGVAVLLVALVISVGCNGSGNRGRRAGSEPIPSSEPAYNAPASSSAPMFPGTARAPDLARGGGNPGGMIGDLMAQEDRRRRAELEALPLPLRDPEAEGRLIAQETMAALPTAEVGDDEGPCVEAWATRMLRGHSEAGERAEFMTTCRALPEEEQRCMSPIHQGQHLQECGEIAERRGRRTLRASGLTPPPATP